MKDRAPERYALALIDRPPELFRSYVGEGRALSALVDSFTRSLSHPAVLAAWLPPFVQRRARAKGIAVEFREWTR